MQSVMYHYVRPVPEAYPYFRYLHVDDFDKQLDWFEAAEGVVGRDAFLDAFYGGPVPERGFVLTFDDGLADHFVSVLPALQERGLWGIFYVSAQPYVSGRMLDVHRVHHLVGMHGGAAMLRALRKIVTEGMLVDAHVDDFHRLTYTTQKNDEATDLFKRTLNYFISVEARGPVLDALMAEMSPTAESDLLWRYYLKPEQLAALHEAGMVIGSHTVSHTVMSKLPVDQQRSEIENSFATLEAIVGSTRVRTFCYPHGGFHTFTAETEALLEDAGCAFSFNVEARCISADDVRGRPQALPRFDCNIYAHGAARMGAAEGT